MHSERAGVPEGIGIMNWKPRALHNGRQQQDCLCVQVPHIARSAVFGLREYVYLTSLPLVLKLWYCI